MSETSSVTTSKIEEQTRIEFSIQHHQTIIQHKGASKAKVFHSLAPMDDSSGYTVVYKVREQDGSPYTFLQTTNLTSTFEEADATQIKSLGRGEDPRAFRWQNNSFCLTWFQNGPDWDHRLINLHTGEQYPLNQCVAGYRGKNWTPLVYQKRLYIVNTIDPIFNLFEYDLRNGCEAPSKTIVRSSVTPWRGGSNFVPYGPTAMIAMGHQRVNANTHYPYLIHVDMENMQTTKFELAENEKMAGILDPTSLWWTDDRLWMAAVKTSDVWRPLYHNNCAQCAFNMSVYGVKL